MHKNKLKEELKFERASFSEVLPVWEQKLWPNRQSAILPINNLTPSGTIDPEISLRAKPDFWKCVHRNKIVAVISGFLTDEYSYRARGLFVEPEYRNLEIATKLLWEVRNKAEEQKCKVIWTLPRYSAWAFYKKFGFKKTLDFCEERFEFGPNCFAELKINIK